MKNTLIIAYKDLNLNSRVTRILDQFEELKFKNTVVSLGNPQNYKQFKNTNFIELKYNPKLYKLISFLNFFVKKIRQSDFQKKNLNKKFKKKKIHRSKIQIFRNFFLTLFLKALYKLNISIYSEFAKKVQTTVTGNFDLIFAHDMYALIAASKFLNSQNYFIYDAVELPHDGRNHSGFLFKNKILKKLRELEECNEKKIMQKASCITTVSNGLAHQLKKINRKVLILRNYKKYRRVYKVKDNIRDLLKIKKKEILLLYLNSIKKDEGIDKIIDILDFIPLNFKFACLGPVIENDYFELLKRKVKKKNLKERCFFIKVVRMDHMINFISTADIGIIPRINSYLNHKYSLPNRVFEFIAARIPILCNNLPDLSKFVETNKLGLTFDVNNKSDIVQKLLEISKHKNNFKNNIDKHFKHNNWKNEFNKLKRTLI